jgi:fructose-1,6-bisphosphatase/inositol monophosphatase family enzyme
MKELENLRKLAQETAKVILETLEEFGDEASQKVKMGAYGAPSSLVDVKAEDNIVGMVKEEDMPYNIFTEEAGYIDRGYEKTIIVDPLDGSYNAEHGIPYFAVSIALARSGLKDVELGIVRNVPTGDEYYAIRSMGAYKNGSKLKVNGGKNLYVIYLGNRAHKKSFEVAQGIRRVRTMGSASLEMCMVAEGIADLFVYLFKDKGVLRIVDIAASYLIVKEAGGIVVDGELRPLEMGMDVKERKNVIAAATRENLKIFESIDK